MMPEFNHNLRFFFFPLLLLTTVILSLHTALAGTTCTITLDANGGMFPAGYWTEAEAPAIDVVFNVNDDGSFTFVNSDILPVLENKHMTGWSTEKNASVPEYCDINFQDMKTNPENAGYVPMDGSVTTLYAVWTDSYYITLDANGGDFGTCIENGKETPVETITEEFYSFGNALCHKWIPDVILRNSTRIHKGWAADKDAKRPDCDPGFAGLVLSSSTPKTLYAIYGIEGDKRSDYNEDVPDDDQSETTPETDDESETPDSEASDPGIFTVGTLSYTVSHRNATVVSPKKKTAAKIIIPESIKINGKSFPVTAVAPGAFRGMKKLTRLTIGRNIKKIGKKAFKSCTKLRMITIITTKLTMKMVGANAFKGIHKKAVVKCPKNKKRPYRNILLKKGMKKTVTFR